MTVTGVVLQLVLLVLSAFGIATLMEWYKKTVRKDQASVWEIRGISAVLSILVALGFKFSGLFTPIISSISENISAWVDVILYAVIIWVCQLEGDMKIVKSVIKEITNRFISTDTAETEIKRLLDSFEGKTTVDFKTVSIALNYLGINEDKIKEVLTDIGVEEDKINELIIAYKSAIGIVGEENVETNS